MKSETLDKALLKLQEAIEATRRGRPAWLASDLEEIRALVCQARKELAQ